MIDTRFCDFVHLHRLTNGIAAFDRKFSTLSKSSPSACIKTFSRCFWSAAIAAYFAYYACMVTYMHVLIIRQHTFGHFLESALFTVPRIADFVVVVTLCFYLSHLGHRFVALDAVWERLVARLLADPGGWTAAEVAVLVECVRLLHAELSGLLGTFNRAYGRALVLFFVFVFFDMSFQYFIMLFGREMKLDTFPAIAFDVQNTMFIIFVLSFATWTNERVSAAGKHSIQNRIQILTYGRFQDECAE